MRWFKHLSGSRQDEKLASLIAKAGWRAYGLWWGVLEIIARQMDGENKKCSVCYPISKWAAELELTPNNVRRSLSVLVDAGLLRMRCVPAGGGAESSLRTPLGRSCEGAALELCVPNLLKYRDEYSQ